MQLNKDSRRWLFFSFHFLMLESTQIDAAPRGEHEFVGFEERKNNNLISEHPIDSRPNGPPGSISVGHEDNTRKDLGFTFLDHYISDDDSGLTPDMADLANYYGSEAITNESELPFPMLARPFQIDQNQNLPEPSSISTDNARVLIEEPELQFNVNDYDGIFIRGRHYPDVQVNGTPNPPMIIVTPNSDLFPLLPFEDNNGVMILPRGQLHFIGSQPFYDENLLPSPFTQEEMEVGCNFALYATTDDSDINVPFIATSVAHSQSFSLYQGAFSQLQLKFDQRTNIFNFSSNISNISNSISLIRVH